MIIEDLAKVPAPEVVRSSRATVDVVIPALILAAILSARAMHLASVVILLAVVIHTWLATRNTDRDQLAALGVTGTAVGAAAAVLCALQS